jgi:UDP-GlcNAc:undecaprenyl-phosphate GlcNAc-1-phosphate transferase
MIALLCVLLSSAALALLLTPLAGRLARACSLVDRPDGRRKIHDRATPVAGGLAVLTAAGAAVAGSLLLPGPFAGPPNEQGPFLLGLLLGAVVIAAVGVLDDFGLLRGRHKLCGQILAALVVIASGVCVHRLQVFGFVFDLGPLAVPFTLLWLLAAVNSLNLLDGMDGLLGSIGVIVSLTLAALAALTGGGVTVVVSVALAGALLGFLRYNLPPASIFLGDCGSMVVGLVLGTLAIRGGLKAPATIVLAAPTVLLTLPLFDTAAAIVRRKLTGRSIYTTDRGHLHHVLLRRGLSRPGVLLLVSAICLVTGSGVLASRAFDNDLFAVLTGAAVVGVLVVTRLFGHAEALLIKVRLVGLGSSLLSARGGRPAHQQEVRLQGTADWTRLWLRLTAEAARRNLSELRLDVNAPALHEGYHARWDRFVPETEHASEWRAEIPLALGGHDVGRVAIAGPGDADPVWLKLAAFSAVVERFTAELAPAAPAAPATPHLPASVDERALASTSP